MVIFLTSDTRGKQDKVMHISDTLTFLADIHVCAYATEALYLEYHTYV